MLLPYSTNPMRPDEALRVVRKEQANVAELLAEGASQGVTLLTDIERAAYSLADEVERLRALMRRVYNRPPHCPAGTLALVSERA